MSNYKLNHLALCVKYPEKSSKFYLDLFRILGLKAEERGIGENIMVLSERGTSIGLKKAEKSGSREGVDHFGFTTPNKGDIENLVMELDKKGISYERKKHRDKSESIFLQDPDNYKIQIVYMPPDMYL